MIKILFVCCDIICRLPLAFTDTPITSAIETAIKAINFFIVIPYNIPIQEVSTSLGKFSVSFLHYWTETEKFPLARSQIAQRWES